MRSSLKSIASAAVATATEIALARIIPALAVAAVAFGHALCAESAIAEAARRAKVS